MVVAAVASGADVVVGAVEEGRAAVVAVPVLGADVAGVVGGRVPVAWGHMCVNVCGGWGCSE